MLLEFFQKHFPQTLFLSFSRGSAKRRAIARLSLDLTLSLLLPHIRQPISASFSFCDLDPSPYLVRLLSLSLWCSLPKEKKEGFQLPCSDDWVSCFMKKNVARFSPFSGDCCDHRARLLMIHFSSFRGSGVANESVSAIEAREKLWDGDEEERREARFVSEDVETRERAKQPPVYAQPEQDAPQASSLGLPYLSAYLDSLGTAFTHGANFATAGSTIRRQNMTIFQSGFSPFSLDVQFVQYNQFVSRSQSVYKRGGVFKKLMPKQKYFSQALYTFDIGQNDLASSYFQNMTTEEVKATVPDVINQFTTVIKYIYGEGGRFFWVHNTGPFGCLPYVIVLLPLTGALTAAEIDKAGCGIPFNEVAQHFNKKLKEAIVNYERNSHWLQSPMWISIH